MTKRLQPEEMTTDNLNQLRADSHNTLGWGATLTPEEVGSEAQGMLPSITDMHAGFVDGLADMVGARSPRSLAIRARYADLPIPIPGTPEPEAEDLSLHAKRHPTQPNAVYCPECSQYLGYDYWTNGEYQYLEHCRGGPHRKRCQKIAANETTAAKADAQITAQAPPCDPHSKKSGVASGPDAAMPPQWASWGGEKCNQPQHAQRAIQQTRLLPIQPMVAAAHYYPCQQTQTSQTGPTVQTPPTDGFCIMEQCWPPAQLPNPIAGYGFPCEGMMPSSSSSCHMVGSHPGGYYHGGDGIFWAI